MVNNVLLEVIITGCQHETEGDMEVCLHVPSTKCLTSCFRSSSDSPAYRYRCSSNSYRVVFVTTATLSGLNPVVGFDKAALHGEQWNERNSTVTARLPRSSFRAEPRLILSGEHTTIHFAQCPGSGAGERTHRVMSLPFAGALGEVNNTNNEIF